MQNQKLQVIEIIRRIEDWTTRPFLCRCDDDELYVVKGMPCVPKKQLIAEWISAHLAKQIGISLPEFRIVYVDQILVEYIPDWKKDLHEGYAFATKYIPNVAPITFNQAHNNVEILDQKNIYLFDKWIKNADRTLSPHGGNPNIIYELANNQHYLIDHNLAFDHDDVDEMFEQHVYSPLHRDWIFDFVDKETAERTTIQAKSILKQVITTIPDEWSLDDEDMHNRLITFINNTVNRVESEEFWRELT